MKKIIIVKLLILFFVINTFAQKSVASYHTQIVGSIYTTDLSSGYQMDTKSLRVQTAIALVVKGDQQTTTLFDKLPLAKEFSKKNKQRNVIMINKQTGKYSVYEAFTIENNEANLGLAETPAIESLKDKSTISLSYESLKTAMNLSLLAVQKDSILDKKNGWLQVADIVDSEGLSLLREQPVMIRGSKGIRLMMDSEIGLGNLDEAVKIYEWLDKFNSTRNDLDVVKITRKTNLSKMFRAGEKIKPFVEAEMDKWKYSEADKDAVRGVKN